VSENSVFNHSVFGKVNEDDGNDGDDDEDTDDENVNTRQDMNKGHSQKLVQVLRLSVFGIKRVRTKWSLSKAILMINFKLGAHAHSLSNNI
jgi:hypothetical protein